MNKAHYIMYKWISEDPTLIAKAQWLTDQYYLTKSYKRIPKRDFLSAFNVILTCFDIYDVYKGWELHIPINNNLYSGGTRRNPTYTSEIKVAIKWLIAEGFICEVQGVTKPKQKGRKKRQFIPKSYMITAPRGVFEISQKPLSDPRLIKRNPLAGYYEVRKKKDKDGAKVVKRLEEEEKHQHKEVISITEEVLEAYDSFMVDVVTSIGTEEVSPQQTSLTRIFSQGSFDKGGRLYSPIQNYKKETRKYLYFDNEPTIEIDYSSFHPHLIYHQAGLHFNGDDPYEIEGFDRDNVKTAFNIMLNRKGYKGKESAAETISYELKVSAAEATAIEEAILSLHTPIAHRFNSGDGLVLQRLDSDIALSVVRYFIEDLKRPIIPIHDSFIVSVRDTESLILAMEGEYRGYIDEVMKGIKSTAQDFSAELSKAVLSCFELNADHFSDSYWNELIAKEGVNEPNAIAVTEKDASDSNDMYL